MRAVNLLVHDQSARRVPNKALLAGAASSSAVLMLLGAGYVNAHSTVQRRQLALDELQAQLDALPPKKANPTSGVEAKLAAEKAGRLAVLSSALSTRVRWDRLLRDLSIVLPGDVWLENLDATSPLPATEDAAPAPTTASSSGVTKAESTFSISGSTYNLDGVARLLIRLQLVPDLENVQLVSSQSSPTHGTKAVQFTITAGVKAPGSGS